MTDPLTLFIGAVLVGGVFFAVGFIASFIFAEKPAPEPMEFEEPPVRTRIWSDAINHERETP